MEIPQREEILARLMPLVLVPHLQQVSVAGLQAHPKILKALQAEIGQQHSEGEWLVCDIQQATNPDHKTNGVLFAAGPGLQNQGPTGSRAWRIFSSAFFVNPSLF